MPRRKYKPYIVYETKSAITGGPLFYLLDAADRWWVYQITSTVHESIWIHGEETHVGVHQEAIHVVDQPEIISQLKPHLWRFVSPMGQEKDGRLLVVRIKLQ